MIDQLCAEFGTITEAIRAHAAQDPQRRALIEGERVMDYAALDARMDQVASTLQQAGKGPGDAIVICASMSIEYAAVFLGALRAGVVVAPLAPGSAPSSLARMVADAGARLVFTDASCIEVVGPDGSGGAVPRIALDGSTAGLALHAWLLPPGTTPTPVAVEPAWPFNIIYSSGTTGEPKGIVQSHGMRWAHVRRVGVYAYGPQTVTLLSTPLYSNTTLVVFFPTLAFGGTVVLMPKFDAAGYLRLAQTHRATHTMLVPVQYQRLMARPDFDVHDLSSFVLKFSTSAPFNAAIKADVLKRWPGGLIEFYGMTEGGGTCILEAHLHPTKLHTVGRAAEGHDIRLIDDDGKEVPSGEVGEVVGHSGGMMIGYHGQPEKTREAEWFDAAGKRFIRTGDVGRFDAERFLTLMDRKKDMVISGGFNVYPSDLEAVLREHPAVLEVAVVGVPSEQWGETPVAFVVTQPGVSARAEELMQFVNSHVGKTQRVTALLFLDELPRSAIGKVQKLVLRERFAAMDSDAI
ncbi:MAG: 4-coumarate--CoA ligase [Burkholderiales bacterium PBB4]|nr:MAG: 4-coumarate--CoA ligase [Burkholderiales bacterium PBB4]